MKHRVITVYQPWAHMVIHDAGYGSIIKNIENRKQKFTSLIGKRVYIHAGKCRNKNRMMDCYKWIYENLRMTPHPFVIYAFQYGAIIGSVKVTGIIDKDDPHGKLISDWWMPGYYGYILEDPQPLNDVIKIPGRQGIWYYDF